MYENSCGPSLRRVANRFTHRAPKLPDTVGWVEHKLVVGSDVGGLRELAVISLQRGRDVRELRSSAGATVKAILAGTLL